MMQDVKDCLLLVAVGMLIVTIFATPFLAFGGCVYMTAAAARAGWGE